MLANYVNGKICNFLQEQDKDFRPGVVLIDGLPGEGAKAVCRRIIEMNGRVVAE